MRSLLVLVVLASRVASADPVQLPKRCTADSPVDEPCTRFQGTYHLEIEPSDCVITKPIKTDFVIGKSLGADNKVVLDSRALIRQLGWKLRRDDHNEAVAAVDTGVCCVQLLFTESVGTGPSEVERRLSVDIARGKTKAVAYAEDRRMHMRGGGDCQNDLHATVTFEPSH